MVNICEFVMSVCVSLLSPTRLINVQLISRVRMAELDTIVENPRLVLTKGWCECVSE